MSWVREQFRVPVDAWTQAEDGSQHARRIANDDAPGTNDAAANLRPEE